MPWRRATNNKHTETRLNDHHHHTHKCTSDKTWKSNARGKSCCRAPSITPKFNTPNHNNNNCNAINNTVQWRRENKNQNTTRKEESPSLEIKEKWWSRFQGLLRANTTLTALMEQRRTSRVLCKKGSRQVNEAYRKLERLENATAEEKQREREAHTHAQTHKHTKRDTHRVRTSPGRETRS